MPYLNQYDAAANDLADFFTDTPDLEPYLAVPVDSRIFEPQKALDPFDENFDWKALEESPVMDNKEDMIKESEGITSIKKQILDEVGRKFRHFNMEIKLDLIYSLRVE